jgi:hypothetical protein
VIAPPATTPNLDFPIPRTAQEIAVLRARRDEISSQIVNVRDRRNTLARQYENSSGANRAGLEQQLRILDQRLAQLELDLASSGRALTLATPGLTIAPGVTGRFLNVSPGQFTGISIVFTIFVLAPLAMSAARILWRRAARPAMPPGWYDASQRLERLEQAVDTVAVEMERVSEGQRFITKLVTQQREGSAAGAESGASGPAGLNGGQAYPALGPASPEPIVFQNQQEEVRVRRS